MDAPNNDLLLPYRSEPLWLAERRPAQRPVFTGTASYDVVVVGAGIAGLVTALLLARAGRSVAVLEARRVGDGTTGHTTGKVSLLQGTKLNRAMRTNPPATVRAYVEAGREGQAWLRAYCRDHRMPVPDRHATTYATTALGEARVRTELAAARVAGLDVRWEEPGETELPFAIRGAVRLDGQYQVDAGALLAALLGDVETTGGVVHEGTRVVGVDRAKDHVDLTTDTGATVRAGAVVLATGQPILDRGGFFARLVPQRSYAAAVGSDWAPTGMHLSADRQVRSLRSVPDPADPGGPELLMVGGAGHVTGRSTPPDRVRELLSWTRSTFTGVRTRYVWSAQDQSPASGLPYVGPLLPGDDRIRIATGFDKWGLSTAPAAALLLAADLLGGSPPAWGRSLRSWSPRELLGAGRAAVANAEVGWHLGCGWAKRQWTRDASPVCTHLGGVLSWNEAERSWDCPLHGSRFAEDGAVLEGPATRAL